MKSGGTRQAVLVAAALAASAVLAAWWWSASSHKSTDANMPRPAPLRSHATGPSRVPAGAPEGATPASIEADKPAPISAPASKVVTRIESNDAKPSSSIAESGTADAGATESPAPSDEAIASDAAKSDAGKAEGEPKPENDASGADNTPGSAVDIDKATDLLAKYLAEGDAPEYSDSEFAHLQHDFDARDGGDDYERHVEEAMRKGIGDWLATLPADDAAGLMLMSVECRVGQCRILMAQANYGFGDGEMAERRQRQGELMNAFNAIKSEPWWLALGTRGGQSLSIPATDGSGMGLWIEYDTIVAAPTSPSDGG